MSATNYTQVYGPDGVWAGFFYTREDAVRWVKEREGFEVTTETPRQRKENDAKTKGTPA